MKDILGREVEDYDVVVAKGTGRNVIGMSVGIWLGSSIVWGEGYKRSVGDVFLVENPSKAELEIKNNLIKILEDEAKEKERKAKEKCIPLSKLEIGGVYKNQGNQEYMYLGNKTIIVEEKNYSNWKEIHKESGNCFIWTCDSYNTIEKILSDERILPFYENYHGLDVLKGNKKLIKKISQYTIPAEIVVERKKRFDWRSNNYQTYRVKIV